jgi:hypothetical protein
MTGWAAFVRLIVLGAAWAIAGTVPVVAQSDACMQGFVPRLANPQDLVCVPPQTRAQAVADNAAAAERVEPGGGDNCIFGYVWRLANAQDHVCVTQQTRQETASDNTAAASRLAAAARSKPPVDFPTLPPPPPLKEGCRRNTGGEWQEVPCATQDDIKEHYPPPEWQFSIKSNPKLITPTPGRPPVVYTLPLEWGSVLVALLSAPKTTSETDNHFGANAYSVQNNTNFFTGSNGHTDWVQFVDQSRPGQPDGLCIWNIDVTVAVATKNQQGYSPTCVSATRSVPDKPLTGPNATAGVPIVVTGYIAAPSGGSSTRLLVLYGQLPDAGGWWSVTAPDIYGLSGNWTEISGSIMGLGGGSQATFTHASLETLLGARSCLEPYTAASCPTGTLPAVIIHELVYYAAPYYSGVTAESNNLVPVIGSPPAHEPTTLLCQTNDCGLWYDSSAP